jgi:hypothetical protein
MSSLVAITSKEFVRGSGRMWTPSAYCRKPVFAAPAPALLLIVGAGTDGARAPVVVVPVEDVVRRVEEEEEE